MSLLTLFESFKLEVKGESFEQGEQVILKVKAKAGAKIEKIQINEYGELEVFIKAKPVEGAANKALKKSLGRLLVLHHPR